VDERRSILQGSSRLNQTAMWVLLEIWKLHAAAEASVVKRVWGSVAMFDCASPVILCLMMKPIGFAPYVTLT
jgi:hypothetical protein